jgi:putative ABC transport system ATP-binding protein
MNGGGSDRGGRAGPGAGPPGAIHPGVSPESGGHPGAPQSNRMHAGVVQPGHPGAPHSGGMYPVAPPPSYPASGGYPGAGHYPPSGGALGAMHAPASARPHAATGNEIARLANVSKSYQKGRVNVPVFEHLTISIPAGDFVAVMGPSGSGKSTLMHCLAGLDTLTSGHVFLGDVELGKLNDRQLTKVRREQVGFVFQSFNLLPTLTAKENIVLPMTLAGRRPDREWVDGVIATVGLGARLKHRPSELSGGQQQRVAVARALASRPRVIFADEPTGNLDSRAGGEILEFMRRAVVEMGQTIVMVTHDPSAAAYADEVVFLADGRIVDEMAAPTAERVLDRIKAFGE